VTVWLELRAPPAIPAAVESRCRVDGERRHLAAGACRRERGGALGGRRHSRPCTRARALRPALAVARRAQPRWSSLRGRGPRVLAPLQAEGWRLRHSLPWRGRGDIDSLAIAPTGVGFAIETKTRTYDDRHLARVREQAAWLSRRRRRWCRRGAVPVVCLVRARGVQRLEQNVLVVSIDRLIPVLRSAVRGLGRPADELGTR